jgi:hypothetical protein
MFVVATGASAQHTPQRTCPPVIWELQQIIIDQSEFRLIDSDLTIDTSAKVHLAPDTVFVNGREIQLPDCRIRLEDSAAIPQRSDSREKPSSAERSS